MGFFKNVGEVLLQFKADTSDAERGLKKLTGAEKEFARNTIEMHKEQNASWDKLAQRLGNFNQILELAQKGIQFATDVWKEFEKAANKAGGAQAEKAREMRSAINAWNESLRQTKVALGEAVASMAPFIQSLADTLSLVNQLSNAAKDYGLGPVDPRIVKAWGGPLGIAMSNRHGIGGAADIIRAGIDAGQQAQFAQRRAEVEKEFYAKYGESRVNAMREINKLLIGDALTKKKGGGGGELETFGSEHYSNIRNGYFQEQNYAGGGGLIGSTSLGASVGGIDTQALAAAYISSQANLNLNAKWAKVGAETDRKDSILASIFGPLDEFDAYKEKIGLLAESFSVFTGALQSGFDAWVSGSKSAKEALADVFKATITGLASTMFAHALEEGALAIGSLAAQNYHGAAMHGAAAAKYAAAGIGIGAIARAINGGGGGGGGGGAGGGGASYSGGSLAASTVDQGSTTTIYIGDGFGSNSPRFERQRAVRARKIAARETGGGGSSGGWG